jgi:PAS domain S-box-containing protein
LAAIVAHSHDAIFSRTLDGTVVTWNAAAKRVFGFTARDILGRSSQALLPRGHRDEFRRLVARIRRGEIVERYETLRLRKDGQPIHVSLTLSPIRTASGRLIGFSTIARDITEIRRAREALERSESELSDLFEEASIGLLRTTRQGRILRVNPALLSILELSTAECLGHRLNEFLPDASTGADLLRRLGRRETIRGFSTLLRAHSGRSKEVLIDASALWAKGRIVDLRWFIRDITRRKQLEREVLAISERERRAFARDLHDSLGQQLSGIAYLSNVLRERLRERDPAAAADADRISRLMKQALEETRRLSRGLSPVRAEPEGLSDALQELATHTSDVFGVSCSFRCPHPVAVADSEAATHLYRIAQEAVTNAIHHGRAGCVLIRLTQQDNRVGLAIADDGTGIAALAPNRKGLGVRVMQYRAGLLGGTLSVRRRLTAGTEVACSIPLSSLKSRAPRH